MLYHVRSTESLTTIPICSFKHCRTDESFEVSSPNTAHGRNWRLTRIYLQMSSDEMHHEEQALPPSMAETTAAINKFHSHCREVALTLLDRIADECRNPLKELHGPEMSSESGLKLISEPAIPHAIDVYENKHRDSGTLTLLFYDSWSLHIRRNEQPEEWAFIPPPPPGCVLVHGASTLDRLSDGRFPAPLHRVTQPQDGAAKRYFLSYFLRPGERKTAGLETVA